MINQTSRLTELRELTAKKKQAESVLSRTKDLLRSENENLSKSTVILKKEYEDVLRLEGNNLSAIFYSFLGKKEDKLDREKQEYLAARLKYNSNKETIARLEEEIQKKEKELAQLGNPETEYADLIKSKSEQQKNLNDTDYLAISQKMDTVYAKYIEVDEAIVAGKKASETLEAAIGSLSKAQGWGTFDLLGGGLIATAVKHSHIDDAKSQIQNVQFQLNRFSKELNDVRMNGNGNLSPDLSGFDTLIDYFFDNLITDWIVQSRINASYDRCVQTRVDVVKIVNHLIGKRSEYVSEYNALKEEQAVYLEQL